MPGRERRGDYFGQMLDAMLSRRSLLVGAASLPLMVASRRIGVAAERASGTGIGFRPVSLSDADVLQVADGYAYDVVIRWGDKLAAAAPEFRIANQSGESQSQQFGYNCDFVTYLPVTPERADQRGLLVVNHESTLGGDMIPFFQAGNPDHARIELAAHGLSVVEVYRDGNGAWTYNPASALNRRITAETPIEIAGPAAGDALMRTGGDPTGRRVLGTINDCSGGVTPWGTTLHAEENFSFYFANADRLSSAPLRAAHGRYGITGGASARRWEEISARFDCAKDPHEPFRFGWVVELDPFNPAFTPRKRTALGRFKHESATFALAADGRVAIYSGDDEMFEYLYKFVSRDRWRPDDKAHAMTLLDHGTLFAARFDDDGGGAWLPLTIDNPALKGAFASQAELLIHTRQAADLVGATAMDRPEDVAVSPLTDRVYVAMTNNAMRRAEPARDGTPANVNAANPRGPNHRGHVIEIAETDNDAGAAGFRWQVLMLCGDPAADGLLTDQAAIKPGAIEPKITYFAGFGDAAAISPIATPDNLAIDARGNLWIATDGQSGRRAFGKNDGLYAMPLEGEERGRVRQFLSGPRSCEICSPAFTPDGRTLFLSIQHPGESGGRTVNGVLENRLSHWPDGGASVPRPSVVAVRRKDGGVIGS